MSHPVLGLIESFFSALRISRAWQACRMNRSGAAAHAARLPLARSRKGSPCAHRTFSFLGGLSRITVQIAAHRASGRRLRAQPVMFFGPAAVQRRAACDPAVLAHGGSPTW